MFPSWCDFSTVAELEILDVLVNSQVPDTPAPINDHSNYKAAPFAPIPVPAPGGGGGSDLSVDEGPTNITLVGINDPPQFAITVTLSGSTYLVGADIDWPVGTTDVSISASVDLQTVACGEDAVFDVSVTESTPNNFNLLFDVAFPDYTPDFVVRYQWASTADCDTAPDIEIAFEQNPALPCSHYVDIGMTIPSFIQYFTRRYTVISTTDVITGGYIDVTFERNEANSCFWYVDVAVVFPIPDVPVYYVVEAPSYISTTDCGSDAELNVVVTQEGTTFYVGLEGALPDYKHSFVVRSQLAYTTECIYAPEIGIAFERNESLPCSFYVDLYAVFPNYTPSFVPTLTLGTTDCCSAFSGTMTIEPDAENPCLFYLNLELVVPTCCTEPDPTTTIASTEPDPTTITATEEVTTIMGPPPPGPPLIQDQSAYKIDETLLVGQGSNTWGNGAIILSNTGYNQWELWDGSTLHAFMWDETNYAVVAGKRITRVGRAVAAKPTMRVTNNANSSVDVTTPDDAYAVAAGKSLGVVVDSGTRIMVRLNDKVLFDGVVKNDTELIITG